MSNVMSLKQIKNKPNRSAFDLSQRKLFTAKVGELLPVFCKEVLPGDNFKLKLNSFTRTQPVNSAAYTRIKEYYDWFFVPYRLLWRYFPQFITDTQSSNPQFAKSLTSAASSTASSVPYFDSSDVEDYFSELNSNNTNYFGFARKPLSYKLLKYLGYGVFQSDSDSKVDPLISAPSTPSVKLNAFPLLAYQKICQDYFRNTQWENSAPYRYNVDFLSSGFTKLDVSQLYINDTIKNTANLFDLNYSTWNKDLFTGLLPSPQYGDVASIGNVSLPNSGTVNSVTLPNVKMSQISGQFENANYDTSETNHTFDWDNGSMSVSTLTSSDGDIKFSFDTQTMSQFSVLALRQAEALQKWREISLSGQQDYKDQIEKHFGVHVPNVLSNLCTWIGGSSSVLDIGEVVNTNLQGINDSGSSVSADIAGKGVGSVNGFDEFNSSEHGILMCLYHATPLMDYTDDVSDPMIFKGSKYDFAIPEFDSVGMQSIPSIMLSPDFSSYGSAPALPSAPLSTDYFNSLGYAPRYIDYKTSVDIVTGAFTGSLKYWSAPMTSAYLKKFTGSGNLAKLSSSFFKVNPSILDTIFAVNADATMSTDNLLVGAFADIKAVRNLDYNGLPY